jgi:hypothetical protein
MLCNLLLVFELVLKLQAPSYKWQGHGGNTTLTKQNRTTTREE